MLYFGTYDRAYPRNAQVISALRRAGVDGASSATGRSGSAPQLVGRPAADASDRRGRAQPRRSPERRATPTRSSSATPGTSTCPPRSATARGRPVVFNPLVSLHDTLVGDRGALPAPARPPRGSSGGGHGAPSGAPTSSSPTPRPTPRSSARSSACARSASRSASSAPRSGSSGPAGSPTAPFHVLFVGKLIPLHGLETILAAAALVPEVPFRVVGSGQLEPLLDGRPANVEWVPWSRVRGACRTRYQAAGCALGIFGTGDEGGPRDPEQGVPGARLRRRRSSRLTRRPRGSC